MKKLKLLFLASSTMICLLLAIVYGFIVAQYQVFPYKYFVKVQKLILKKDTLFLLKNRYSSIFVNLQGVSVNVPVERKGYGGALTSMGEYVLVLTHEGKLFAATSPKNLKATNIGTPENNFEDYLNIMDSPDFGEFTFRPDRFRQNNILDSERKGERGLLVSYTKFYPITNGYANALSKLVIGEEVSSPFDIVAEKDSWELIYESKPCLPLKKKFNAIEGHMAGGRIAFDGENKVYLANGDYHWDGIYADKAIAQDMSYEYGKVVSIDMDTLDYYIVASGLRNMQGITIDKEGRIWTLEHGMRGGDELNLVQEGKDYGFPSETLGTLYSGLPAPNTLSIGRHENFEKPIWAWLPSIAISSLSVIDNFHESWDGDLLAASLRDGSLHRIRITGNRAMFIERISIGQRIRYAQTHKGKLVLWTDSKQLHFLSVDNSRVMTKFVDRYFKKENFSASTEKALKDAINSCINCHSLDPTENTTAPSLALVFGSWAGTTPFAGYTSAIKNSGKRWNKQELTQFLMDPSKSVPGTSMPDTNIENSEVVDGLVRLLEVLKKRQLK